MSKFTYTLGSFDFTIDTEDNISNGFGPTCTKCLHCGYSHDTLYRVYYKLAETDFGLCPECTIAHEGLDD